MRKNILALLDSEPGYAVRFMEYVNRKRFVPFDVHAFTEKEPLRLYMEGHQVEVLLISEKDYEASDKEWPAESVILLTDEPRPDGRPPSVGKYQSAVDVMRGVMRLSGVLPSEEPVFSGLSSRIVKMPARVVGVFSPVGRCLKTTFSLTMGMILARSRPTLCLNLESCSGLAGRLHASWESSLADLIFYIREGEQDLGGRILPLIQNVGDLALLPPVTDGRELYSVRREEWHALFAGIRNQSAYEYVVADLGDVPMSCPEILDECDFIYMPVAEDSQAKEKLKEYEGRLLPGADESDILERIRKISPAGLMRNFDGHGTGNDAEWLQSLPYGPVGQMARELLEKESLL